MPLISDNERLDAIEALLAWLKTQDLDPYNAVPVLCEAIIIACLSLEREADKPLEAAVKRVTAASQMLLETAADLLEHPERHRRKKR